MRAPGRPRPLNVYCGNFDCASRSAGRVFTVIDTTDMSDGERAELLIDGVDSFKQEQRAVIGADGEPIVKDGQPVFETVRVQTSWAKHRYDGELTDGEVWLCPDCREEV